MRKPLIGLAASLLAVTSLIAQNETNVIGNAQNHTVHADGRGNVPTNVPRRGATTGTSGTNNGINYNGGPVMLGTTKIYYIWYGDWTKDSTGPAILTDFANNIGGSPYFNINTTYSDASNNFVSNSVVLGGTTNGTLTNSPTSLTDANIWTIVQNAIASGAFGPADPNGMYFVLTAPGIAETSGFLTQYCGWHTYGSYNGTAVKYSFVGNASGPNLGSCAWQTSVSPNNDPGADGMISVIAHELEEAVTDPLLNAWYDSTGAENADKCAWTFGTTYSLSNGSIANMVLGSRNYLIQQNWINAGGGSCGLSYSSTPDYSLSITPSSLSTVQGGTTASYTIAATPNNGFTGTVNLTGSGLPTGASFNGLPPSLTISGTSAASSNFTVSTQATTPTGTSTLTVAGSSGSLNHSATAKLTVNPAGSFSVTGPSSITVTRGSSNSATITVTGSGGFNSPVQLSVSGLPSKTAASFSTNPVVGGSVPVTSTLTIRAQSTAQRTTRTIKVTGVSGNLSSSANITLTIQ